MSIFRRESMKTKFYARMLAITLLSTFCLAQPTENTWQLDSQAGWQNLADAPNGSYLLAIAKIKQTLATGTEGSIADLLTQLKTDYPDLAGPDLDAYIEAEIFLAKNKWSKASEKYELFLDTHGNSWLYPAALDRQFSIATAFLTGQKRRILTVFNLTAYDEGEAIMNKIADRTGDAPIAKRALISVAESFEKREKFLDAYDTWADISSRWPTGDIGRTALLNMAQTLHSAYRSPHYDPSTLKSAQSYYRDFKARYPELAEQNSIDVNVSMIDQQLAYKKFKIGEYYDRTGSQEAADIYYNSVIDNWPFTDAAQMAKEKLAQSGLPEDPQKRKDLGEKLFDTGNKFLDNWFNPFK